MRKENWHQSAYLRLILAAIHSFELQTRQANEILGLFVCQSGYPRSAISRSKEFSILQRQVNQIQNISLLITEIPQKKEPGILSACEYRVRAC